ncbi:MAG: type-4 uracil-DNA glycosylase [Candidatus Bathyarchaeaceae archaeon]
MPKLDTMKTIEAEVRSCSKCQLWKHRKNAVPGEGNIDATVMFVGEAPGYWEDVKGKPFVGAAGKLLDEMLSEVGFSRGEVYITNVVKCRPPENRDPLPSEIETCTPYLDRQIRIIEPRFIVTLGRHAASHILPKAGFETGSITEIHGRVYEANLLGLKVFIIPMYHPAAALYNAKYKDELNRDFQLLKAELERRR